MPLENHSAHPCAGDYWPVPVMVAFMSNLIQLFLFSALFGVPEGLQAALDIAGFHGQKKTPNSFIPTSCSM